MADTRVEDIESDSDSSSFDDDDFTDDSDDNKKIARDIFGDSVKTMKFSRNFPSQCLKCKLDSQEGNLSGREQDDLYLHDQPRQGLAVNIEGNTRPINIFSLIFTDELTDNLVEWTNRTYAQKK